ncbi:MAG: glycoside hydrolase family 2 protein, partial [Clostridia bacterium]|nr:glycoside hydrolase family 2 protein [Clostridia bacterium]
MRNILNLNENWLFVKDCSDINVKEGEQINLPHSWNALDGQDGGNDYFRGYCLYTKSVKKSELPEADLYFIEFRGTNSSADLYVNGNKLAHHDGGYSTWRVNITEALKDENEIAVVVENTINETVYPQMADFTFYGGIYRDVNLICVNNTHFDLDYYGGPGIKVTPEICGNDAKVNVEVYISNPKDNQNIRYTIYDANGEAVAGATGTWTNQTFDIKDVHL